VTAPPKIVTRQRAWACAAMNQLAFPGLGTIMAGRRIGYVQAVIMVVGFCLFVGFMLQYFAWFARFVMAQGGDESSQNGYRSCLWMLFAGLGLTGLAWCWALLSSISIVRKAQPTK
jgi:hypothetical protein